MDTIETTEEKSTSNKSTFEVEPNLKELITSEDHSGFSFNKLFNRQESAEETPIEEEKPLSRFESFRQKVDYRKPNEDRNKSKFSSNRSHGKSINTHSTQYQRQKLEQFFQNQNAISLFFFSNNDPRFRTDKFLDEEEAKSHVAEWKDRSFQIKLVRLFFISFLVLIAN